MNQEAIRVIGWKRFAELLHGPLRSRMRRDIDVKESAARILNDHKHVEHAKRRRDYHTEITGHYALGMIADERGPGLGLMTLTLLSRLRALMSRAVLLIQCYG